MSRRHTAFALLVAGLALVSLCAYAAKDEGELTVNLFVNYGSAFKDKTWAPVDVVIKNEREDIQGWVELQTYSNDMAQSPVYRQPVELPKGSQKRIQFHCYLNGATRLVAQIYDGRRPMLGIPAEFAGLRPIPEEDLLCLVLDDEGGGFQFLYVVVSAENGKRGIHRENLGTDTLPFLSEYPQAYEPIDLIVLGNFDPQLVGARQRELLYNYVRNGGVVAVCTGEFARKYRGSWVEDLLGAKVGADEALDEAAFAKAVFPPEEQTGARAGRQIAVAALEPVAPEVERIGTERVLATRRALGAGCVYALAVDADSQALQDTPGYRKLWREISMARRGVGALNVDAVASYVAEQLPQISGIVVHSKASVILYLLVYFLVAVVGNWMFFSWLRRREWAWAALVVFAVGFTAYAMVYGTSGRAQSSEMHQVQVVRVPQGGGICTVDSLAGILTARTSRYGMVIQHPYPLVEDLYYRNEWINPQQRGLGFGGGGVRPFTLVQGEAPRIENFSIGASELRMVRLRTDLELDGAIEGTLVLDNDALHGELINRTGFPLDEAFIEFRGQRYGMPPQGGERISVNIPVSTLRNRLQERQGYPQGTFPPNLQGNMQTGSFWESVPHFLFTYYDPQTGMPLPQQRANTDVYLCGWSRTRHAPSVALDTLLAQKTNATLVVADVAVTYSDAGLGSLAYGDLRHWATERTDEMDGIRAENLPALLKAVREEVKTNSFDDLVSDLIGNYSQLTQRFGQYKPAAELAVEWGVSDKEASEATLWDRAIESWVVFQPRDLDKGVASLAVSLSGEFLTLSRDDSAISAGWLGECVTIGPAGTQGFVRLDKLALVSKAAMFGRARQGNGTEFRNYFSYALTEIWSPNERDVVLAHGVDDWSLIWINGNEVFRNLEGRDATINQEHLAVHLKEGKNIVLVKCGNEMGEWEFSLAFEQGCEGLEARLPEWAPAPRIPRTRPMPKSFESASGRRR